MALLLVRILAGPVLAIAVWYVGIQRWRPKNQWLYALRVSLWGAVVSAYFMGRPLVEGRYQAAFGALVGGWLVFWPILFSLGVVRARRRLGLPRQL